MNAPSAAEAAGRGPPSARVGKATRATASAPRTARRGLEYARFKCSPVRVVLRRESIQGMAESLCGR
ncbi:hypothetical protein GCM10009738_11960 [Kitasatospora viridis]